ncbi:MAG: response regulator [Acidobacteriota bacterium]|nr:MAG: response regulator [Acidobacteriota bacterium]
MLKVVDAQRSVGALSFVLLLLSLIALGEPPQPVFRTLTPEDGLSQSHVGVVVQDAFGYTWIGTADGLDRFDGHEIRSFRHSPSDPDSLSSNIIHDLHFDDAGGMWVGTENGLDHFDPRTEKFSHFIHDQADPGSIAAGAVVRIQSDSEGWLWAVSSQLNRIDPRTGRVEVVVVDPLLSHPGGHPSVLSFLNDSKGRFWVGTGIYPVDIQKLGVSPYGLFLWNSELKEFLRVPSESAESYSESLTSVIEGPDGNLWIGTWGRGLRRLETATGRLMDPIQGAPDFIKCMVFDREGALWLIGRDELGRPFEPTGLYRMNPLSGDPEDDSEGVFQTYALGSPLPTSLYCDRWNVLWVGTSGNGLFYGDLSSDSFGLISSRAEGGLLGSPFVRSVVLDQSGILWVGTTAGLDLIDRETGEVRSLPDFPQRPLALKEFEIRSLAVDPSGAIWVGTAGSGLHQWLPESKTWRSFQHDPDDPATVSSNWIETIYVDRQSRVWLGTSGQGLDLLEEQAQTFQHFRRREDDSSGLPNDRVTTIYQTSDARIWVGTEDGLALLNGDLQGFQIFEYREDGTGLPSNRIRTLCEDPVDPRLLWIGTADRGLARMDRLSGTFTHFSRESGDLPNNSIYGILPEEGGGLWISSNRGLIHYISGSGSFKQYGPERRLQGLEFNSGAYHRGWNGELFFGGVRGLNHFFPGQFRENPHAPLVLINQLRISSRSGEHSDLKVYDQNALSRIGLAPILLSYDQRDLVIAFAGLQYADPQGIRYQYRLDPFDADWRQGESTRSAVYTNLDPGEYMFQVTAKASNGREAETPSVIQFRIQPPFWATVPFYLLVGLAIVALVYGVARLRTRNLRQQRKLLEEEVGQRTAELQEALDQLETQTELLQKLDSAKSELYSNLSHEFRTPLTLMLSPLQDLSQDLQGKIPENALERIRVAQNAAEGLLKLTNELLDLAQVEGSKLRLEIAEQDLVALLKRLSASFHPLAERRRLKFRTIFPSSAIPVFCDRARLLGVFSNLLSNAMKYTPEGGTVTLAVQNLKESGRARVEVEDTGLGIAEEELPNVFDRFFRGAKPPLHADASTGIGLALAKELIEMHGGEISVRSHAGSGSTFVVELKTGVEHLGGRGIEFVPSQETLQAETEAIDLFPVLGEAEPGATERIQDEELEGADSDATTVLIVEDNDEVRELVASYLTDDYRVIQAVNGVSGLELARTSVPDLIICDLMMSGMDGFELCRCVRNDPSLDFVPVVILTARAAEADRLKGLDGGADDYLTKPFSRAELQSRVRNLIELRHRLRNRLMGKTALSDLGFEKSPSAEADRSLVERIVSVIERNLSDEDFGVEELAGEVAMSRIHLYRRLRDLVGLSPGEMIIHVRMQHAAQLLLRGTGSVGEIAYGVGFKSVSHFTRRFRQRFGRTPSEYRGL